MFREIKDIWVNPESFHDEYYIDDPTPLRGRSGMNGLSPNLKTQSTREWKKPAILEPKADMMRIANGGVRRYQRNHPV